MAIEKPINEILVSIENGEYTIPEFQRGFVWNPKQIKEFFRSLYLKYPSGSFLIWKTKNPSKLRGDKKETNSVFHNLILDGQQRLTTIYTIFKGETPNWYEGVTLRTDLYFNLMEEEFEYYTQMKMKGKKEWINVSDFLKNGGLNQFLIDLNKAENAEVRDFYLSRIHVLTNLESIRTYGYYIKEVSITELEKVVEIFNLVNKSGTTLSASDLALAIITSNWDGIKDRFRKSIAEYEQHKYYLSFNFFTRCLNMVTTNRGKYTSAITEVKSEEYEQAWEKINKSLAVLINVLREHAFIDSTQNISTEYVLYVLVYYLSVNDCKFQSTEDAKKAIYWLFMAQLWGRYSGSSESYLEKDLNIIKSTNSIDDLIKNLEQSRGSNLYLTPDALNLQGVRSKIYNIYYCSIRAKNAKDWTDTTIALYSKNIGYQNALQRHHIFPKAYLYQKYTSANSIHRGMINEIANIAFVTQSANLKIFIKPPFEYLPNINQTELRKQYVPLDDALYTLDTYENFLITRRRLICEGINDFLKSYYEYDSTGGIPTDLVIHNERIEKVEIALRNIIDAILNASSEAGSPFKEFIPSHVQLKTNQRLESWLKKNPGEDKKEYQTLRRKLDYFDLQEYKDVFLSKQNWQLFEEKFGNKTLLMNRFSQLGELRNCIRHSRTVTEVIVKEGEASLAWFESILRPHFELAEV